MKETDVLCFETEGAGLMNHFRFLIICSVCNCTSMVRAVYVKGILWTIPPNKLVVEEEEKKKKKKINNLSQDRLVGGNIPCL